LHLTGNLSYYIGAQIGGTGYVRHRDLEFRGPGESKELLLKNFDHAIETVVATIANQSDNDWATAYTAEREPESKDRFAAIATSAFSASLIGGTFVYDKQ
jgi:hypothetical protein